MPQAENAETKVAAHETLSTAADEVASAHQKARHTLTTGNRGPTCTSQAVGGGGTSSSTGRQMGGTGEEAPAEDGATGMGEEGATDDVGMGEGGATRGSRGDERSHSHSGISDVVWE